MIWDFLLSNFFGLSNFFIVAFLISLPVFAVVFIAVLLHRKISQKYKYKWFQASLLTTYLMLLVLIFFLYAFPFVSAYLSAGSSNPPDFPPTLFDQLAFISMSLIKVIFSAFVLTFLLMPVEFLGVFFIEKIRKKKLHDFFNIFLAVYACTCFTAFVFLAFPQILRALIFLIFWG